MYRKETAFVKLYNGAPSEYRFHQTNLNTIESLFLVSNRSHSRTHSSLLHSSFTRLTGSLIHSLFHSHFSCCASLLTRSLSPLLTHSSAHTNKQSICLISQAPTAIGPCLGTYLNSTATGDDRVVLDGTAHNHNGIVQRALCFLNKLSSTATHDNGARLGLGAALEKVVPLTTNLHGEERGEQ